ncbi:MAG TPA: hypothetical protein VNL77_01545 [Roseiflexaceae bacterium]|nr:hypothetical protein [Roseiflexaceae bacterium]
MDIYLAAERAFQLTPQYSPEVARDRVEQHKTRLVAGTVGALFSQPKPDEIRVAALENRLEPFWLVVASSRTVYDRTCTYLVPVGGPEVRGVTVLGQELAATAQQRGAPAFSLPAVEHCVQELRTQQAFDAVTGARAELAKHAGAARAEIGDLSTFAPEGVLVIPPQVRATAVARQVIAEVVRPVQGAQAIHEERVDIETVDLIFRPVYAFEYEWAAKNKRAVVEFDAITGEFRTGGRRWSDQIKGIITGDVLFDITADAVGMIVPGGNIAVKLVKAVVDRGR